MSDWGTAQQSKWLQTWVTEGENNRVNDYRHEWLRDRTTGSMTTDMGDWGTKQQGQWLQTWVTEGHNDRVNDIQTTDMSDLGTEQQCQWLQTWVTEEQNNRANDYRHEWLRDRTSESMTTNTSDWVTEQQGQWHLSLNGKVWRGPQVPTIYPMIYSSYNAQTLVEIYRSGL